MSWDSLITHLQENWNEETIFQEEYVVKAIIKGMKNGNILQIQMDGIKNMYKGHSYKLD